MTDLATATQNAFYAALNVAAVTSLASLYQHVPENVQPPLVMVGDISLIPLGGKDGGLDQVTVEIVTLVRAPKRAALFALQAAIRNRLDLQPITAFGALLSSPVQTGSDASLLEDGETYMGTQTFETIVQPA